MILDHNLTKSQDASLTSSLNDCLLLVVVGAATGISSISVKVVGFAWVASISSGMVSLWSWKSYKIEY